MEAYGDLSAFKRFELTKAEALKKSGEVKTAIVMIKAGVDEEIARELLAKNEGIIAKVFASLGIEAER